MNRRAITVIACGLALAAVLAGCGKKHAVGSGVGVKGNGSQGNTAALGATTTTVAPTTTAPKNTTTTAHKATTTTARQATTTTAAPTLVIKIQSSTANGGAFDPAQGATVPRGSLVRWQNTDSQARSVIADNNSFASPMIPPGGTFDYIANTPGKVGYHDGTRPFAVGSFDVQ